MLLIYVDQISPRISYALDFIFSARGHHYKLTTDASLLAGDAKIFAYTKEPLAALWIPKAAFMSSQEIEKPKIETRKYGAEECFSFNGIVDPIANVFYLLTRYEEYCTSSCDKHARFPLSESILPDSWIELAKCDRWAEEILSYLNLNTVQQAIPPKIIPTFDIDNSYAYLLKGGKRKLISTVKDLMTLNFVGLKMRKSVLGGAQDPYDTYEKIKATAKQHPESIMFWLIGKWGEYDRNISIKNEEHQALIRRMKSEGLAIGLHPSYGSFQNPTLISKEKEQLEGVLDFTISASRQHYLRFSLPLTYEILEASGFKHEYSMGFAERVGFRCGTARPHYWFNLARNRQSELMIHPFVYMDGTLREYMNLSIPESKMKISQLYAEVERYGGDFVFIWHNETIGDYGNWKGWTEVLDHSLNLGHESN